MTTTFCRPEIKAIAESLSEWLIEGSEDSLNSAVSLLQSLCSLDAVRAVILAEHRIDSVIGPEEIELLGDRLGVYGILEE